MAILMFVSRNERFTRKFGCYLLYYIIDVSRVNSASRSAVFGLPRQSFVLDLLTLNLDDISHSFNGRSTRTDAK